MIERAFWFSEKKYSTGPDGHPMRSTGGILEFLNVNNSYVQNQGGPITAGDFNSFLREGFTYGNDTKWLFAGGNVLQSLTEIARGSIQTKTGDTAYGMKINEWITPFGSINVVYNPLFTQEYAGYAFLLDMDCFKYVHMNNRDTKLMTNVQAPDVDGEIDQYITEVGLQRMQAQRCSLLKGVTV